MAISTLKGKYKCLFCEKEYDTASEADECVIKHELYYIPMTKEEINQLIQYIYDLRDPPIQLIGRLKKIMRNRAGKK